MNKALTILTGLIISCNSLAGDLDNMAELVGAKLETMDYPMKIVRLIESEKNLSCVRPPFETRVFPVEVQTPQDPEFNYSADFTCFDSAEVLKLVVHVDGGVFVATPATTEISVTEISIYTAGLASEGE